MLFIGKPNRNIGLWWLSIISISIGLSIFILLGPAAEQDYQLQRYRALALVACIMISGLCIIIGTRGRWFGKGL